MELRPLGIEDLILCDSFGAAFLKEGEIEGSFSLASFCKYWSMFLTSGVGTIIGLWDGHRLVGGIGGLATEDINTGQLIASELFWYVDPKARHGTGALKLLKAFRQWGKDKGAVRFRMVHLLQTDERPSNVTLDKLYRKMQLRPIEVAYDGPIGD